MITHCDVALAIPFDKALTVAPPCPPACLPCSADQRAFLITLTRAGEDNARFRLTDLESTLNSFASADYDLQVGWWGVRGAVLTGVGAECGLTQSRMLRREPPCWQSACCSVADYDMQLGWWGAYAHNCGAHVLVGVVGGMVVGGVLHKVTTYDLQVGWRDVRCGRLWVWAWVNLINVAEVGATVLAVCLRQRRGPAGGSVPVCLLVGGWRV